MNRSATWLHLLSFMGLILVATSVASADVLPEELPPPLETSLPMPRHIVIAGLAFSVVLVLLGLRMIRAEKLNRMALNTLLFLVGAATASLAYYANKIRADYGAEVQRVNEINRNYRGGGRPEPEPEWDPTPLEPDGSLPPAVDPPAVDPPAIDPPAVD